jgi:hypothetical protein
MALPAPPRASAAKCAYHLKQLRKFFARADDTAFLQMIWAVDALQSGREAAAKRFIVSYPPEAAATSSLRSPLGIHRWELEPLLIQLLLTPKQEFHVEGNLVLDCSKFDSIRETVNRLRALENVESANYLAGKFSIGNEMHRIAQRQFHWQRGYFNTPQLYRYAYVYAQGQCAEYFQRTHGFAITDLIFTGFGLFAAYQRSPWVPRQTSVPEIGLTDEIVQRALPLMSSSLDEARAETAAMIEKVNKDHGKPIPTALLPSVLRKSPLISAEINLNQLTSPIPELILLRVTAGLYYDLIPGGQALITEANDRFEQYSADLISAMMERFDVSRAYRYGSKGAQVDTPDVLIKENGKIVVAAECKATKLTYLAQFSEDPFETAKQQYAQIAKGVFQLWRFFSHIRRGILKEELAPEAHALVFTLDAFLTMARDPHDKVFAEAKTLADHDGNITEEDRRPVVICPIADLEAIFAKATEDSFLASLKASYEEKYSGWKLREVHRDSQAASELGPAKRYPFELDKVLPWWSRFDAGDEEAEEAIAPPDA